MTHVVFPKVMVIVLLSVLYISASQVWCWSPEAPFLVVILVVWMSVLAVSSNWEDVSP